MRKMTDLSLCPQLEMLMVMIASQVVAYESPGMGMILHEYLRLQPMHPNIRYMKQMSKAMHGSIYSIDMGFKG